MMSPRFGSLMLLGALLLAGPACGNAGADKVLSITATGRIEGGVYFDENGSGRPDGAESGLPGFRLSIVAWGTRDTVARPVTGSDGTFATPALPVGRYIISVPPSELGDTVAVVQLEDSLVSLLPEATGSVTIGIGYPAVSIAEARALPIGRRVFLEGIALTALGVFGDTTTHFADGSGAIRATRVGLAVQLPGDSMRVRGTLAVRDGQPVLDDARIFVLLGGRPIPPAEAITTVVAASASQGRLDAGLARVANATVSDTATSSAGLTVTVDDGSGAIEVLLDADVDFGPLVIAPGASMSATGVLVPDGAGSWRLKPRSRLDVAVG
jgi:hypothetical protein